MRVSVLSLLALALVSAEAKLSRRSVLGVNPFVPRHPKHRHAKEFAALRAKHAEGLFSKAGPRLPDGALEVTRRLGALQEISAECQRAVGVFATKTTCGDAMDFDKQMASASREAALCGTDGCLAAFRKVFKACQEDMKQIDPSGAFRKGAIVINAMNHLCPAEGSTTGGCFKAADSYEANIDALENAEGTDAEIQAKIGRVCNDPCTKKIQRVWLMTTETLGDREAVEEAQAHIIGQEVVCTKDNKSGRFCFPDVHEYFDDDEGSDGDDDEYKPENICPKPCARKAFLKFVHAFGNKQLRDDFKSFFRFLCIKSNGKYCMNKFNEIFDDDDEDKCPGNDAAVAKCIADVAATDACTDAYKPGSTTEVNPDMSCACANAIVDCEKKAISTECMAGFKDGCKGFLTTCPTACDKLPESASSSDDSDPCEQLMEGQCPADCKTNVETVVKEMGCCIPAMVRSLESISTTGELQGIHEITKMFKGANQACDLGFKWTKEEECQKLGKVQGKLGLNGVTKADVDKAKDKFYKGVSKDISDSIGAPANVTSHEATGAAGRLVRGLQTGVAFNYDVEVEDDVAAAAIKDEIKSDVDTGNIELTNTNAEVAKVNPGAEATVSKEASTVETVKVTPTPDPNASPSSDSSASTVTASIFAVLLGVAAALF